MTLRFQRRCGRRLVRSVIAALLLAVGTLGLVAVASAEKPQSRARGEESARSRWRDATPSERRAMRDFVLERRKDGSQNERRMFRRGMRHLNRTLPDFSPIERRMFLRKLAAMAKPERERLRKRLLAIDGLESKERAKFVEELRSMIDTHAGEVARFERNLDRWERFSKTEREEYRGRMRRFRALSAEDQRRLLEQWVDPGGSPDRAESIDAGDDEKKESSR